MDIEELKRTLYGLDLNLSGRDATLTQGQKAVAKGGTVNISFDLKQQRYLTTFTGPLEGVPSNKHFGKTLKNSRFVTLDMKCDEWKASAKSASFSYKVNGSMEGTIKFSPDVITLTRTNPTAGRKPRMEATTPRITDFLWDHVTREETPLGGSFARDHVEFALEMLAAILGNVRIFPMPPLPRTLITGNSEFLATATRFFRDPAHKYVYWYLLTVWQSESAVFEVKEVCTGVAVEQVCSHFAEQHRAVDKTPKTFIKARDGIAQAMQNLPYDWQADHPKRILAMVCEMSPVNTREKIMAVAKLLKLRVTEAQHKSWSFSTPSLPSKLLKEAIELTRLGGESMTIWFTSDHHFGHSNIIKYCERPFSDTHQMNVSMEAAWNRVVAEDDLVYYLGDFAMNVSSVPFLVSLLNGTKILIPGNHDKCWQKKDASNRWVRHYLEAGFQSVEQSMRLEIAGQSVLLNHLPYRNEANPEQRYFQHRPVDDGGWLIHGHVHNRWKVYGRQINVSVEMWNFEPVSLDCIAEIIKAGPTTRSEDNSKAYADGLIKAARCAL